MLLHRYVSFIFLILINTMGKRYFKFGSSLCSLLRLIEPLRRKMDFDGEFKLSHIYRVYLKVFKREKNIRGQKLIS